MAVVRDRARRQRSGVAVSFTMSKYAKDTMPASNTQTDFDILPRRCGGEPMEIARRPLMMAGFPAVGVPTVRPRGTFPDDTAFMNTR
jgi:hypothetical protein